MDSLLEYAADVESLAVLSRFRLELGITVYPPRQEGGRWRAVWHEDGGRQQCESVSQEKLAVKLEKVRQRLATGAANMTRPGADLIAWRPGAGQVVCMVRAAGDLATLLRERRTQPSLRHHRRRFRGNAICNKRTQ